MAEIRLGRAIDSIALGSLRRIAYRTRTAEWASLGGDDLTHTDNPSPFLVSYVGAVILVQVLASWRNSLIRSVM